MFDAKSAAALIGLRSVGVCSKREGTGRLLHLPLDHLEILLDRRLPLRQRALGQLPVVLLGDDQSGLPMRVDDLRPDSQNLAPGSVVPFGRAWNNALDAVLRRYSGCFPNFRPSAFNAR